MKTKLYIIASVESLWDNFGAISVTERADSDNVLSGQTVITLRPSDQVSARWIH